MNVLVENTNYTVTVDDESLEIGSSVGGITVDVSTVGSRGPAGPAGPAGGNDPTTATYDCPSGVVVTNAVRLVDENEVDVADNGSPTTADVFGFVIAKPTATQAVVRTGGRAEVFTGLTPNQRYWLGSSGAVATSPPVSGVVQQVGKAVTATVLQVAIQPRIIL